MTTHPTDAYPARPEYPDPSSSQRWRSLVTWLWAFIPLLSVGILGWVPAVHAWVRLRERAQLFWMLLLCTITVMEFVLISLDPTVDNPAAEATMATVASTALIPTTIVLGSIHSFRMRRRVFDRSARGTRPPEFDPRSAAAVAEVERARARRAEARALVERDPAMARELAIGRPDLPGRGYDDGGLVDLNHASAEAMVAMLHLTRDQAEEIVRARTEIQGASSLEELSAFTTLSPTTIEGLRERAVFLRY